MKSARSKPARPPTSASGGWGSSMSSATGSACRGQNGGSSRGKMADLTWEGQFRLWVKAEDESPWDDRPANRIVIETRKNARNGGVLDNEDGWEWVARALRDGVRLGFVHAVF